jgi:hypothetical protein
LNNQLDYQPQQHLDLVLFDLLNYQLLPHFLFDKNVPLNYQLLQHYLIVLYNLLVGQSQLP